MRISYALIPAAHTSAPAAMLLPATNAWLKLLFLHRRNVLLHLRCYIWYLVQFFKHQRSSLIERDRASQLKKWQLLNVKQYNNNTADLPSIIVEFNSSVVSTSYIYSLILAFSATIWYMYNKQDRLIIRQYYGIIFGKVFPHLQKPCKLDTWILINKLPQ